jgi:glycosyltransferase involved in cell wall biosynthesis
MARRDLSQREASSHAASELEFILRKTKKAEEEGRSLTPQEAMAQERVYSVQSNRDITRVLFISRNTELLNPTRQTLDGYIDISDLFDEVHILILRQGIPPKHPVLRVAGNVWVYTVSTRFWWQAPKAGLELLKNQLVFASGFRPDLIVARDPFESAMIAYRAGELFSRPTQLHVMEDFTTAGFITRKRNNFWRRFMPRFTVPHFASVRTLTGTMQTHLQKRFSISDIGILPRFQDYEALIDAPERIDLKEKYRPQTVFLLFIGKLTYESTLFRAMDAAKHVLKNERIGLIVLGDGPARSELQKRARGLGIERQVIFERDVTEVVPYLKSGHILLVTDTDADSEEVVLKGAAAGIPMIMAATEKRSDVFTDGESAFVCEANSTQEFTHGIHTLLNDIELRKRFMAAGQDIIRKHFHADPMEYRTAYRESIEEAFFVDPAEG